MKKFISAHKKSVLLFSILYILFYTIQFLIVGYAPNLFDARIASSSALIVITSSIFKIPQKYFAALSTLSLATISLIMLKLFIDGTLEYILFNRTLGYTIGITNITLITTALLNKNKLLSHLNFPFILITLLPVIFIWSYYFTSGAWINTDTILALLQTNPSEAKEYIFQFVTFNSFLIILIIISAVFIVKKYFCEKTLVTSINKVTILLLSLSFLGNTILTYKCRDNLITSVFHEAKRFTSIYDDFNKFKDIRKANLSLSNTSNKGVYVLVVGESHSRDFTSAYGYSQNTTPFLKTIHQSNNAVFLKNAFSCHIQTTPSVTYALTSKNQYNTIDLKDSLSILEVAEKAGFETVWLSNQSKFGLNDTPITVIAEEANQQLWINGTKLRTESKAFDEEVLNFIPKINLNDDMLIIIHIMGSHASYKYRYPKTFEFFKGNTVISEYNNSLRYTDYVLEKIYNRFSQLPNFQAMIYFSDHGEKPGVGHDTSNFDKCMSHIPVTFIFSSKYINNHPEVHRNLKRNQNHIFTNDLMFNAILGTMGIKILNFYEPHNDITNEAYNYNQLRFTTMYGKVKIID